MKCVGNHVCLIVFLLCSWQSFAWDKRHMVSGDVDSVVRLNEDDQWMFSLGGAYAYLVTQNIQMEQELNFSRRHQLHGLNLLTGITYNFSSDLTKSIFVSGLIGLDYVKWSSGPYSNSSTEGLYSLRLGKRFALAENISWNLFLEYKDSFQSYSDYNNWNFHLFSLSVYF